MRNFKKVIAAGLALLMLALSVNVSFAAESYTDKEAVVVAKVNAAGIMTGTDKGFEPSKTLTRAEAAAIMVRMKGISESTVKQNTGATLFTDVAASHWAAGYINVASNYNLIKGVGAGLFAPEKEVTVAEFYTMAIRALGAGQLVEAEGTWPTNYVNFAIEYKLSEDVAQVYTLAATRMSAATIVANTLETPMWVKKNVTSKGEITWEPTGATILAALNIAEVKGTIGAANTKKDKATITATPSTYNGEKKFAAKADLAKAKENITYTIWYDTKEKEVVGFWVPEETDSIVFTDFKKLTNSNTKIKLVVDGEETEYSLVTTGTAGTDFIVSYNGTTIKTTPNTYYTWTDLSAVDDQPLFGIAYFDAEGKSIQKIFAERYVDYAVVKEVKNNKLYMEDFSENSATITLRLKDEDPDIYHVTKDGKAIEPTDIEEGDAIFYYKDGNDWYINVNNNTVSGKIKSLNGKAAGDKINVDGTSLELGRAFSTLKAGNEGTFYLNDNGKVVMYNPEKEVTEYAMIGAIRIDYTYDTTNGEASVKLAKFDGELTDWMGIHKDSAAAFAVTALDDQTTTGHYDMLGTIVKYDIKGNEVKLLESDETSFTDYTANGTKGDSVTAGSVYYLTSSTKIGEVKSNDKSGYKEEWTIKVLDADELDTTNGSLGKIADLDDKEVGIVLFDEGQSDINEDEVWAFVLSENPDYENEDNDKLTISYEIAVSKDGKTEKMTVYGKSGDSLKGKVVAFALDDENVIENYEELSVYTDSNDDDRVYVKDVASSYVTFVKDNSGVSNNSTDDDYYKFATLSDRFYIAEDLLVISSDKNLADTTTYNTAAKLAQAVADAKFKVSDLSSIDNVETKAHETIEAGTDTLVYIYMDKNSNDEDEVVAILYFVVD